MPYLNSSAISYVEYSDLTRELHITFRSGGTYTYYGVPRSVYEGLISASSAGQYYHQHIEGRYGH